MLALSLSVGLGLLLSSMHSNTRPDAHTYVDKSTTHTLRSAAELTSFGAITGPDRTERHPGCHPHPDCPRCSVPGSPSVMAGPRGASIDPALVPLAMNGYPTATTMASACLVAQECPPPRGSRAQAQLGPLVI